MKMNQNLMHFVRRDEYNQEAMELLHDIFNYAPSAVYEALPEEAIKYHKLHIGRYNREKEGIAPKPVSTDTIYFIDEADIAQELTDIKTIGLANKHGKYILNHVFIETFNEEDGVQYVPVSQAIKQSKGG